MKCLLIIIFAGLMLVGCDSNEVQQLPTLAAPANATATGIPTARPTLPPTNTPSCRFIASDYVEEIEDVLERWDDANELALSTSRIALSGPLSDLQEIKRDTGSINPPPCAQEAHNALIYYMEKQIEAFLSFLSQDSDAIVSSKLRTADSAQNRFTELWSGLR